MKKFLPALVLILLVAAFVVVEYGDELNIKLDWSEMMGSNKADKPKAKKQGSFVKKIHYDDDVHQPVKWKVTMKYNEDGVAVRHGESFRYWESGTLASKSTYVDDKKEGPSFSYYRNGKVWKEQFYINDKISGLCKRFDRKGSLTAEYPYKAGFPGLGLKEFTNLGKQRKQPVIKVQRIDELRTAHRYTLKLSLTGENVKRYKNVTFYSGQLIEGLYFNKNMSELEILSEKEGQLVIDVPKGYVFDKTLSIVAVAKNKDGLKLILNKKVEVSVRGV